MNKKEIAELRRRLNPDKNAISRIRGCYVNEKREIISSFDRSLVALPQEEAEKYLSIFKRTLSGMPGRNLIDIAFRPDQLMEGREHALLMELQGTALTRDEAVDEFFGHVIDTMDIEGNYLILLMHDSYDVPHLSVNDEMDDAPSDAVYSYILAAICPVKLTKPALAYFADDREFHTRESDRVVAAPEAGFLFPDFSDRGSDLSHALYYVRDTDALHEDFVSAVFAADRPVPATEQKEAFECVLADALEDDLKLEVVQTVHDEMKRRIEESAADKEAEPPVISRTEVANLLETCGIPEEKVAAFEKRFDAEFGPSSLPAAALVNEKQFEVKTPDVVIRVNPEKSDLVETRVIDGFRYILIRAEEGVEVNGVPVNIAET